MQYRDILALRHNAHLFINTRQFDSSSSSRDAAGLLK